jgi:Down syndrome cell adhesion protein
MKEGNKVMRNERFDIIDTPTADGVKSELTIRSSIQEDTGMFVCIASNSFGRDEMTNKVFVLEVPSPPSNLQVKKVWSRSVSISWIPSQSSNIPLSGFVVQYWRESETGVNHALKEMQLAASQTEIHLDKLLPGTTYGVTVLAVNDVGRSLPASTLRLKTGEEEPSGSPVDVFAEAKGSSTIRVTWKSPPRQDWNGLLEGFYVGFKASDEDSQTHSYRTVHFSSSNNTFEHFIPGLKPKTKYTIILKAFNSAGTGPPSQEIIARTHGGDFIEAPKIHAIAITADSISLHCQLPKSVDNDAHNTINGFIVHFRPESSSVYKEVSLQASTSNDAAFVAKDLTPNTLYHFYATVSKTGEGEGDPSSVLSLRTKRLAQPMDTKEGNTGSFFSSSISSHDINTFIPVTCIAVVAITLVVSFTCVKKAKLKAVMPPVDYYTATLRPGVDRGSVFVGTTTRYIEQPGVMQGNNRNIRIFQQHQEMKPMMGRHRPLPDPNVYDLPE